MAGNKNSGRRKKKVEIGTKFQKGSELGLDYLLAVLSKEVYSCPSCGEEVNTCPSCGEGFVMKVYQGDAKTLKEISQYFIDHNYGKPPTKLQLPSGKELGEKLIETITYVKATVPRLEEGSIEGEIAN